MSSLASLLSDLANPIRGPKCYVGVLLAELAETDPEGRTALIAAIDNHSLAATVVAKALHEAGHTKVKTESIRRHRKRGTADGCACS